MAEKLHAFAQEAQIKTLVLDHRSDLTGQFHKMMDQQAHDMESISYDLGIREPSPDQVPVRVRKIDTDHPHVLTTFQTGDKAAQISFATPPLRYQRRDGS
jgi:hypothetical protein